MITQLSRSIAIVLTIAFLGSSPASAACQTFYPFLTDMPSIPTSTRLNFELFDQLYSTSMHDSVDEISCPENNESNIICSSAYEFPDGTLVFSGYAPENFSGALHNFALNLEVHGIKAKLAPIPMNNGMLNMGYRDPNVGGEVVLTVWMPSKLKDQYSDVALLYPLLLRAFEADVCESD